jgi:fermentation-respiration switch protein FrsA (DUF1100 family)
VRAANLVAFLSCLLLASCDSMIDRLVFFPDPLVGDPPAGAEERWITTSDGVRIHAWYATHPRAVASLVWSHGNGGNIDGRGDVAVALAARGFNVLLYDYRGYGKSQGTPSERGVHLDAEAAYDSEREHGVAAQRIVCFGESLGGAVSIHLASRRPCAAVVVLSTFTSLRDVARSHYGPFASLAGQRFDSLSGVVTLRVPFFAAHGDRDAIVPFALGERLFAAAHEPKRFVRVPGAGHNDIFDHAIVLDEVTRFVREHVPPAT